VGGSNESDKFNAERELLYLFRLGVGKTHSNFARLLLRMRNVYRKRKENKKEKKMT